MKYLNPVLFLLLLAGCAAPESASEEFWSHRFSITPDLPYGTDPSQLVDVYLQGSRVGEPTFFERKAEPLPTLIFIHGGAWLGGQKEQQSPLFMPFVERGWHVVNVEYRLGAGTAPAAVDDAMCALKWVVDNAGEYGFDTSRIVVSGGSAGGHLSLTTGILGSREGHPCYPGNGFAVAAVINWFGITDIEALDAYLAEALPNFNYARAWAGGADRVSALSAAFSPVAIVDGNSPPVLSIHGDSDTIVPFEQATSFHARLNELDIQNQLVSLEGGTHFGFSDAQFQEAFGAIFTFLDEVGLSNERTQQ